MPSRIIREGWLESERIASLDASGERFFLRLCLRADDFGRFHAQTTLLKSSLFPLSEDIRSTDIPRWLAACEKAGLLRCYEVEAKRYLEIHKFGQRTRALQSKFPAPPSNDGHAPDIVGHPRTESESESDASAVTRADLPDGLNTPAVKTAWGNWLVHWSTSFANGRPMPEQTAHSQLRELLALGPDRAIAAIENAITKGGLRKPCEPFNSKTNHADNRTPSGRGFSQQNDYSGVSEKL